MAKKRKTNSRIQAKNWTAWDEHTRKLEARIAELGEIVRQQRAAAATERR